VSTYDNEQPEPSELTKVARDLSEIEAMHGALEDQAVHKATDRLMPGGHAMVMLSPVADPEAWEHVFEAREALGRSIDHIDDEDADWETPLQSLRWWSGKWRAELASESDFRPTLTTEAGFIRQVLEWAWENVEDWDQFAKDVRAARVRVENTLYAGNRADRTRVPCIEEGCGIRLIKVYGETVAWDHYKCPGCKRRYDVDEFVRAKLHQLDSEGAARWVRLQDAMGSIDRPERTFRKWLLECKVAAKCEVKSRQVWVWWPDVRLADLDTPRRRKAVA
jgi:hypothetical protein